MEVLRAHERALEQLEDLDGFVVGDANRMADAAEQAVTDRLLKSRLRASAAADVCQELAKEAILSKSMEAAGFTVRKSEKDKMLEDIEAEVQFALEAKLKRVADAEREEERLKDSRLPPNVSVQEMEELVATARLELENAREAVVFAIAGEEGYEKIKAKQSKVEELDKEHTNLTKALQFLRTHCLTH